MGKWYIVKQWTLAFFKKLGKSKEELQDTKGVWESYIEEEQTWQWLKEKTQTDKQRSTKHTHQTKDRVTRTPLKNLGVNSGAPN